MDDIQRLIRPDDSLLDIGCYHGWLYDWLGHEKYQGIELFAEHVAEAKKRHPEIDYQQGDLFDLKGRWDVIVASRVLMHIPDYERCVEILRGCARRLVVVVIPIGQDELKIEDHKGSRVYLRVYPKERILATKPMSIIKHEPYCTVVYEGVQ